MNQRLLIIAGAISAFSLVLLGGVFAQMSAQTPQVSHASPNPEPSATVPASSLVMPEAPTSANPPASLHPRISSEQAQQIAQKAQPTAQTQGNAELVRYGGQLAYEVAFAQGKMYVHADNGAILGNSMAPAPSTASSPQPMLGGRGARAEQGGEWAEDEQEHRGEHKKYRSHQKYDEDEGEEEREHV